MVGTTALYDPFDPVSRVVFLIFLKDEHLDSNQRCSPLALDLRTL